MNNDDSFHPRGVLVMLASVVLFAANTLLIRAISLRYPAVDGWVALLFRGGVGLAVVWLLFGWGRGLRPSRLLTGRLVVLRGIVGAVATVAFYISVFHLPAGRAVVLNLTYPLFATLVAALWLKETIRKRAAAWMAVGFAGLVVFLCGDGKFAPPSAYDLVALAGAAGAGWVVVMIRRLRHEEHPATIYASQALYSLLLACPAGARVPHLSGTACWGLVAAAVIVTFGQLIMTRAYQTMSVSRGSALQMVLPLVTAAGGYAFFGETFHIYEIAGGAIALIAVWRVVASK